MLKVRQCISEGWRGKGNEKNIQSTAKYEISTEVLFKLNLKFPKNYF